MVHFMDSKEFPQSISSSWNTEILQRKLQENCTTCTGEEKLTRNGSPLRKKVVSLTIHSGIQEYFQYVHTFLISAAATMALRIAKFLQREVELISHSFETRLRDLGSIEDPTNFERLEELQKMSKFCILHSALLSTKSSQLYLIPTESSEISELKENAENSIKKLTEKMENVRSQLRKCGVRETQY